MKVVVPVFLLVLVFVLTGCNGIQVVDNVYGPVSGQQIQIAQDFDYLGNPEVYTSGLCTGIDCPSMMNGAITIRSDVFAKKQDETLAEFCVIEKRHLKSTLKWNPIPGQRVKFGDHEYVEEYIGINNTGDSYTQAYANFFQENGFKLSQTGMVVRLLVRNVNSRTKMMFFYGMDVERFPKDIRGDSEKETEFLQKRFDERFSVIDS